jgi:hypothetical protein
MLVENVEEITTYGGTKNTGRVDLFHGNNINSNET